jgi:hypothetical protein
MGCRFSPIRRRGAGFAFSAHTAIKVSSVKNKKCSGAPNCCEIGADKVKQDSPLKGPPG